MQHVIQQLETVRRVGRLMLIARRLLQFVITFCIAALACGLIDYALRLPGWMRLLIVLALVGVAAVWLVTHLGRAFGFAPDLSVLALRAERLFPHLAGALASGVEFAEHPEAYADPQRTGQLAKSSVAQVERGLGGDSLQKLINPKPTIRVGALALIAMLVIAAVVMASPASAAIAAQRWLMPLGQTEWPRRTHITSLVTEQVQPADAPLRMSARVDKGYEEGMRAWVMYQVEGSNGEFRQWQSVLMSEQAVAALPGEPADDAGLFERLIDLAPDFAELLPAGGSHEGLPASGVRVRFYFKAGDDWTEPQDVRVVPRPAVKSVTVTITPPEYAKGLVKEETVSLDRQSGRTAAVSGLEGSTVEIRIRTNKPIRVSSPADSASAGIVTREDLQNPQYVQGPAAVLNIFPGVAGQPYIRVSAQSSSPVAQDPDVFVISFKLGKSVETPIRLIDEHGLENLSDRTYRIDMRTDALPTVAMIEPPADESVLATAVVKLEGTARDDVAVESIKLEAALPLAAAQPGAKPTTEQRMLEEATGRADRLAATHQLDLSKLGLKPGDVVSLTAVAQDIFNLDGKRHEPVRSTPRTLRIVDAAALINQIRSELSGLRQQAMRTEARQQELKNADPATAQPKQDQITQTLTRQQEAAAQLGQRVERNKLADPQIAEMINRTKDLLNKAGAQSQEATQKLDQARREEKDSKAQKEAQAAAHKHQENVEQALKDVIGLLDEGRSALALQAQLRQLDQAQKNLAQKTQEMLPRTAGRNADELSPQDKKALEDIAQQQKELAKQADELVKQMKAAAEALDKQGDKPEDKATAQALNEAANLAQREGLKEKMEDAAKQTEQNKLSQANEQQDQASKTMQQMMGQMQGQDKKQQEMLKRQLAKLEESIRKLLDQQQAQLARLREAKDILALADPLSALRRNTLAVAEEALVNPKTAAVGALVTKATQAQSDAIFFLRGNQQNPAIASEEDAVKQLEEALKLVKNEKAKQEQEENQQKRDELKGEYEKLAKEQDALRDRTRLLTGEKELNRRQKQELSQLGNAEADLQIAANKLKEKVGDTLVFQHLHGVIDDAASNAVAKLRALEVTGEVTLQQQQVSDTLRMMAKALEDAKQDDDPFEKPDQQRQSEDQQGEGASSKPKLVPDLAELRLLRVMQESLYKNTRGLAESNIADSAKVKQVEDLSKRQMQLHELGNAIIRKMGGGNVQTAPGVPKE